MTWTEGRVRAVGTVAIGGLGSLTLIALGALVVAGATGALPAAAPAAVAGALIAVAAWAVLLRHSAVHLTVLMAGFIVLFNSEPGIQTSEVAFGVYYLTYLFVWVVRRVVFDKARLVRDRLDLLLLAFLGIVTAQAIAAPLYGGDPVLAVNQWRCTLILAFYFPIRETVREDPSVLVPLTSAFLVAASYLAIRNLYLYYTGLQSAEALYQLVFNRSREGERVYAIALIGAVAFAVQPSARPLTRAAAFLIAVLTGGAIIGGMSRTIWVAILPALAIQFVAFNAREWRAVGGFLALTAICTAVAVPLFVGDAFEAVAIGLALRAGSIASSASQDLSLINRFYEWNTAIEAALQSPVLGRGFGVPYSFYDILYRATDHRPFSHSTYIGVFYRHGFVGLGLFLSLYLGAAWRAARLVREEAGFRRTLALTTLSAIALLSISISTEGTLLITDGAYSLMYPLALVGGLWWSREPRP